MYHVFVFCVISDTSAIFFDYRTVDDKKIENCARD